MLNIYVDSFLISNIFILKDSDNANVGAEEDNLLIGTPVKIDVFSVDW